MNSTAIPLWKRRFVVLWYDFIRSEKAYDVITPLITRDDKSTLSNKQMTDMILEVAKQYDLPVECWPAVLRYYSDPKPDLSDIVIMIEPITITATDSGVDIHVSPLSSQAELEEYLKLNYGKHIPAKTSRLRAGASARKTLIVNKRLVHKQSYREIANYLMDNGIDMEEPNIRRIVSEHKKRIK